MIYNIAFAARIRCPSRLNRSPSVFCRSSLLPPTLLLSQSPGRRSSSQPAFVFPASVRLFFPPASLPECRAFVSSSLPPTLLLSWSSFVFPSSQPSRVPPPPVTIQPRAIAHRPIGHPPLLSRVVMRLPNPPESRPLQRPASGQIQPKTSQPPDPIHPSPARARSSLRPPIAGSLASSFSSICFFSVAGSSLLPSPSSQSASVSSGHHLHRSSPSLSTRVHLLQFSPPSPRSSLPGPAPLPRPSVETARPCCPICFPAQTTRSSLIRCCPAQICFPAFPT